MYVNIINFALRYVGAIKTSWCIMEKKDSLTKGNISYIYITDVTGINNGCNVRTTWLNLCKTLPVIKYYSLCSRVEFNCRVRYQSYFFSRIQLINQNNWIISTIVRANYIYFIININYLYHLMRSKYVQYYIFLYGLNNFKIKFHWKPWTSHGQHSLITSSFKL